MDANKNILSYLMARPFVKHFLFWVFVLIFHTLLPAMYSGEYLKILFSNVFYLIFDGLFVYLVLGFIWPRFFKKGKLSQFILLVILVVLLDFITNYLNKLYLLPIFGLNWTNTDPWLNFYQSASSFSFILGLALFGKIVGENYQIQQIIKEKEQRYLKAEIAQLRSQVNPHFLFNVLNNIDEMIYEDPDKASLALHNMSSILRYSFKDSEGEKVPLESEIQFIRDYIHLMKTSFQDPHFIELKISGECNQGAIAPMVLIPFVENTIKHARKQVQSPGIRIHIDCHLGELNLQTQNSLRKTDTKTAYTPGFGLQNVMKRLELIYPEKHDLSILEDNGLFTVNLKILTS